MLATGLRSPLLRRLSSPTTFAVSPGWRAAAFTHDARQPPPPSPPRPPQEGDDAERAATLPTEQLAKALLAGNARAQLTTVAAGVTAADDSKVSSSIVSYCSVRGEAPLVFLTKQDGQHLANITESPKASLATGHVSPPWFVQQLRGTGWLPRRVALLGDLQPLPPAEVKFELDQARKACKLAPGLAALLPAEEQRSELLAFRLTSIKQCVYVDATGWQHAVDSEDLHGSIVDPLALPQHDLLAAVNQSPQWRQQLQLFAAAYLGVSCSAVLLSEADRLGFSLLGAPLEAATSADGEVPRQAQRWRQFRIGSSRELKNAEAFMSLLEQMKQEVHAAAAQ
ncbi:hypothetical protein D9Q98_004495 [Chlorella vulgaris]|uniref:DUF2470 domain-containing protein n=1 Tax=Chlorella vulgaris TaxID=3077 RepID=A0A9D4TPS9_CHLVU|nr:hypothetical protein D9Q98_004495 [Chlorella vulgaris]